MWGGVKAESFVTSPKVEDIDEPTEPTRSYPALEDSERLGNEAARERYALDAMHARQALKEAQEREERRERLLARLAEIEKVREELRIERLAEEEERRELARKVAQAAVQAPPKVERKARTKVVERKANQQRVVVSRSDKPKAAPIVFEATAYIAMCDTGCTGITATGLDVRNTIYTQGHRIIAVDPSIIPLGSLVRVNTPQGAFSAVASDTGGDIKGHRVDILMSSTGDAEAFGRQNVSIQILRNGAK